MTFIKELQKQIKNLIFVLVSLKIFLPFDSLYKNREAKRKKKDAVDQSAQDLSPRPAKGVLVLAELPCGLRLFGPKETKGAQNSLNTKRSMKKIVGSIKYFLVSCEYFQCNNYKMVG